MVHKLINEEIRAKKTTNVIELPCWQWDASAVNKSELERELKVHLP